MNTLRQKQWPEFKNFTIEQDGLRFETRQDDQFINALIDFDQIGTKEIIVNQRANPYGVLAFVSIFINVLILLVYVGEHVNDGGVLSGIIGSLIVGFSFWARQLFKSSKQKVIQGPDSIPFFYNKKEQERVDKFIEQLQSRKVEFLRNKYMKIDRYTPTDQLNSRFIWLRQNHYITDSELDMLMEDLDNRKLIGRD